MTSQAHKRSKLVTSLDVANLAGVSASTVSLVVNGKAKGRVSPENQEKVLNACRELGYNANAAARSMRLGYSRTIGLFVPNVINPFFPKLLRGAQRRAYELGYNVLLMDMMENPEWQGWMRISLAARTMDGCILYSPEKNAEGILDSVRSSVVLVEVEAPPTPSLMIDVEGGIKSAMRYLFDLGHTRIGYIDADYQADTFKLRLKTYRAMLEEQGIQVPPGYIQRTRFGMEDTFAAAEKLLQQAQPPTAVLCSDDLFVSGVYKSARTHGLQIPEDLSVIGFNDSELARMLEPELTTVAIPAERVGEDVVDLLLEFLKEDHTKGGKISTELIIRRSAGWAR